MSVPRRVYREAVDPLSVALIAAIVGAVVGVIGAVATTSWVTRGQLKARARYQAEANLRGLFRGLIARLEIERRANYPTISSNNGPFDVNHREQFVLEVLRNLTDLPKNTSDDIRSRVSEILGEEAILYCDARAYLPDGEVDIRNAAKSTELIKKAHAGTFQIGLVPRSVRAGAMPVT